MFRSVRRFVRRLPRDQTSTLLLGLLIGFLLALLNHFVQVRSVQRAEGVAPVGVPYDFAYERFLAERRLRSEKVDPDVGRYNDSRGVETEAAYLSLTVPVACLVFPDSLAGAETVLNTWGRHCNGLLMQSQKLQNQTLGVQKRKARSAFELMCNAFRQIVDDERNFSWLLVATDNTFALVENLRYFVAPLNHSEPHYLGHGMGFWAQEYNWGDAGYALSRGALQALLAKFPGPEECAKGGRFWKNGDWYLGKHLGAMGVRPVDTRDHMGRGRFNGYSFKKLLFPGGVSLFERYWKDSLYLSPDGPHCCSNFAITFHGIASHSKMYQLEYLFHHLRPFYKGGKLGNVPPKSFRVTDGNDDEKAGMAKETFLTWEEQLKDKALASFLDALMTTPKSLTDAMKPDR